jgi:hypothetical protein
MTQLDNPIPSVRKSRVYEATLAALFLGFLLAPVLVTAVNIARGPGTPREESRAPTPRLSFGKAELKRFPGALKWYFTERFGLKETFVHLHGLLEVKLLGTSSSSSVVLGKKGWLFLASEGALDYHRGAEPLGGPRLRLWLRELEGRRAWLEQRGIEYAFVVAPNTHSIYPEFLPDGVARGGRTRLDQLLEAARTSAPRVRVVDLRPSLLAFKDKAPLYFQTDTHWQPTAAFLATRTIAETFGLPPPAGELLPVRRHAIQGGDLARLLGLAQTLKDEEVWPAAEPEPVKEANGALLPSNLVDVVLRDRIVMLNPRGRGTAVIFRDSFGEALIPWVSGLFARTVWISSYEFSEEVVLQEQPQIVIEQVVERKLMNMKFPGGGVLPCEKRKDCAHLR